MFVVKVWEKQASYKQLKFKLPEIGSIPKVKWTKLKESQHPAGHIFRGRISSLAFLWWWQHIASAAPNPIAARPTFPKMFGRSPDKSDHCRKCSDCHSYSENGRLRMFQTLDIRLF